MKYFHLFCALIFTVSLSAQDFVGKTFKHQIESEPYQTTREIDVYVPFSYSEMPADSFMVLYIFDGQFDPYFTMTSHMAEYLYGMGEFPPFIAVGIRTEDRPKEFTPKARSTGKEAEWGGESDKLEDFLTNEVFPLVDRTYRTKPLRLGIGHSFAGTFVSDCIFTQNELFKGVISISPNTVYDKEQLAFNLNRALTNGSEIQAFHFMTAGTVGDMENKFRKSSDKLDSIYKAHPQPGFIWQYETYDGLTHGLTPPRSISEGLVAFANHIQLNENKALDWLETDSTTYMENVQKYYTEISEWLGYRSNPSIDDINNYGYLAAGENMWQTALSFFEWGSTAFPDDANIYDSKGEALENLGQYAEAYKAYSTASEKLVLQKAEYDKESYDWYIKIFKDNANRVKEKM